MTFTEAAVEVLRRAGRPLHYREIAEVAVGENLLSHVGQDPEVTMGQRLAAMAKREEERKVVAVEPEGTFALTEWNVSTDAVVDPVAPPLHPDDQGEPLYRPREREPRPIHAQARRRMEALRASEEPPGDEGRRGRERGQKRFPPPAEVVFEWLVQRQSGAPLHEMAEALFQKNLLSEALVRDLPSLVQALLEDNRRRTEAGRKPAFIVDGERVTLVEFPPPAALAEVAAEARPSQSGLGRPITGSQLAAEGRRAVVRALRRRMADLETAGFEHLCHALLDKMGMREVRVAKRSKEGPLYLARQRRGVSDLRVAVKLVRGGREIARSDVQELRKDLAHYSAQMGLVLAPGDAAREARAEASAAGQAPVALFAGDSLAEELVALKVGVTVQMVELADVDEAFFAAAARAQPQHAREEPRGGRPRERPSAEAGAAEPARESEATPPEVAAPAATPPSEADVQEPSFPPDRSEQGSAGRAQSDDDERRRGRASRATNPAEQAWGQPAGTPRRAATTANANAIPNATPTGTANPTATATANPDPDRDP